MSIYFVRHQAAGVVWEYPFGAEPTQAQVAAVEAICAARHGAVHPKTRARYWSRVEAVDVLDAGDIPTAPEPSGEGAPNVARIGAQPIEMGGRAHIKNP